MTYKKLTKDSIEEIRKLSEQVLKDEKTIQDNQKKIDELKLETAEIAKKYKGEYDYKINPLSNIAILTYVNKWGNETGELHIKSLVGDELTLTGYIRYRTECLTVSLKELLENDYVIYDDYLFIANKTEDSKIAEKCIYWILNNEKQRKLLDIEFAENQIKEYTEKLKNIKEELKQYEVIEDKKIERLYDEIHFGICDLEAKEFLKKLPREIKI